MPLTKTDLDRALRTEDERVVIALFADADEDTRKAFAPQVKEWWHTLSLNQGAHYDPDAQARLSPGQVVPNYQHLYPTAFAAALACLTLADVKAVEFSFGLDDEVAEILTARRPPWIADYCEFLCAHRFGTFASIWRQVRALVRAGLCPPPSHDNYALGAIEGIRPIYTHRRNQRRAAEGLPPLPELALEEHLLHERDWLETAFWKLFELEGNSRVSLANRGFAWIEAVVALSRRDLIDRNRLLDASLDALNRDFRQFRVRWFSQLHEALVPTVAERAVRLDTYLSLLGSPIPPTVTFALEAVVAIDAAQPIPAKALLPALSSVLAARGKAVVKNGLQLLDRLAERDPAARRDVCHAATTSLLNPAVELQKVVLSLLERYGERADTRLKTRLSELVDAVAPSLRPRMQTWLEAPGSNGPSGAPSPGSVRKPKAAQPTDHAASKPPASTLDPSRAIIPITTLDELLDRAAAVLEAPDDPNEIERVLDGICRLCDQRPPDFERRVGPLGQRALTTLSRFQSRPNFDPVMDRAVAGTILSWLAGNDLFAEATHLIGGHNEPFAFLFRRLAAVGKQVSQRRALPLLSAPTHRGGWIEPQALVTRWLQWQEAGASPDRHEQVVALLRLAPEQRAGALSAAGPLAGEAGIALRFALGGNEEPTRDVALSLAAHRSRTPHGDLPGFGHVFPKAGPDGGEAARYRWQRRAGIPDTGRMTLGWGFELEVEPPVPSNVDGALLPVLLNHRGEFMEGVSRPLIRWTAFLWPAHREGLSARGIPALQLAVEWSDTRDRETCGYLDALIDSHARLGPVATLALALGLAAQDVALRGLAQEALIAAIPELRVDAVELGGALSRMWDTGLSKLARLTKSFAEVARISPEHAVVVAELVRRTLHGDPARAPRELGAMLELLVELQIETDTPLTDPRTREYLAAIDGTGKSARLAKQLLKSP
jgi:hypothetical protein